MAKAKHKHEGPSFDSFLEDEGLNVEVAARVAKRTFVHQLEMRMVATKVKKSKLREALGSPTTATRVLNEDYTSLSLDTMTKAASVVGCELKFYMSPIKTKTSK